MNAPRSKNVTAGGREFVVRPLIVRVADEIKQANYDEGHRSLCEIAAKVLQRTAPDVTAAWLFDNADTAEIKDILAACSEVSGRASGSGEVPAP